MISNLVDFIKHLEKDSLHQDVFDRGQKPSAGIHLWVELDDNGNWINNMPVEGVDFVVYNGKEEVAGLLIKALKYENYGKRMGTTMNKVLDLPRKQIFSCSPYIVSYKKKSYANDKLEGVGEEKILNLLPNYFAKGVSLVDDDGALNSVSCFQNVLPQILKSIGCIKNSDEKTYMEQLKEDDFINIYLESVPEERYFAVQQNYLKDKLFNKNDYNSSREILSDTYGLSNYLNGANAKKPFLEHKTASMFKGISGRITLDAAQCLYRFEKLISQKVLPNPLPLFVDDKEFKSSSEFISIYKESGDKKSYSEIVKELYDKTENRVLSNYYLLFISRGVIHDFDFVSQFRYKIKNCVIRNILRIEEGDKNNRTLKRDVTLDYIFSFEHKVIRDLFNNSLVKLDDKKGTKVYNYFNDIDENYVSGGSPIALLMYKYRRAVYDYIYKSKVEAITCTMFDDICYTSIMGDVRSGEYTRGHHSKTYVIREKMNIWFSLYNYFNNTKGREDMENRLKELFDKMDLMATNELYESSLSMEEFMFGMGQVIYYLFTKSEASSPKHDLLEPFLQKSSVVQLQNAVCNTVNMYKHALKFGKGKMERLCAQLMVFESKENLKNYHRYLLAGYFSPCVIYKKREEIEAVEL